MPNSDLRQVRTGFNDVADLLDAIDPEDNSIGRKTFTVTNNPSNYSSGGTKLGYYSKIGDLIYVHIQIISYTSTGTPTEVTWDCLPFAKATDRVSLACSLNVSSTWIPASARVDLSTTVKVNRDAGATFPAGATSIILSGFYFYN